MNDTSEEIAISIVAEILAVLMVAAVCVTLMAVGLWNAKLVLAG